MSAPILVLNGPNLNTLGMREPNVYGKHTLDNLVGRCADAAARVGRTIEAFQTNHEGDMLERIHAARGTVSGIVINPGAWTHTSIALHDALMVAEVPIVEVHLSNVYAREAFRHHSYVSPIAKAVISGLGPAGYVAAIEYLANLTG